MLYNIATESCVFDISFLLDLKTYWLTFLIFDTLEAHESTLRMHFILVTIGANLIRKQTLFNPNCVYFHVLFSFDLFWLWSFTNFKLLTQIYKCWFFFRSPYRSISIFIAKYLMTNLCTFWCFDIRSFRCASHL